MLVYGRVWGPIKRLGIQGSSEGSPVKRAVWVSAVFCYHQWGYSHLKPQVTIQLLIWRSPGLTLPRVPQLKTPKASYKNIKEIIMLTSLSFCPRLILKNSLLYVHLFSVDLLSFCRKVRYLALFIQNRLAPQFCYVKYVFPILRCMGPWRWVCHSWCYGFSEFGVVHLLYLHWCFLGASWYAKGRPL